MRYFLALPLILAIAACSGESPDAAATNSGQATTTEAGNPDAKVSGVTPAPSPMITQAPAASTIPAGLRGRWGLVPADCTSTRGDAKGLMIVDASTLRFYESVGTMQRGTSEGPLSLDGSFAFTGEGMNWSREVSLVSHDGGNSLDFKDSGADSAPSSRTYTRCK